MSEERRRVAEMLAGGVQPEGSEQAYSNLSSDRRNLKLDPHLNGIQPYVEMAYGTPHEPFLKGELAYGAGTPLHAEPVAIEPTQDAQLRYASTYAESRRNPILALGMDFSRLGLIPHDDTVPINNGVQVRGAYWPTLDRAIANSDSNGGVDRHELMHRGFYKLGGEVPDENTQHRLMAQHDTNSSDASVWDYPAPGYSKPFMTPKVMRDKATNTLLQQLQDRAAHIMYERRPYGGPR